MKVIWDDLGRSIKLIVCAMGNYYLASIWIKEKDPIVFIEGKYYSTDRNDVFYWLIWCCCNCRTSKTNLHLRMGNKAIFFEV